MPTRDYYGVIIRPGRLRDERGAASVELVVLFPVLLTLLWVAMSAAMFYYGRTAAITAAQTGAAAAAAETSTLADCRSAVTGLTNRLGDTLSNVRITCTRTATQVQVTVTGTTLSLVPGWQPQVTQTATQPRERITR